jgi:hypothetical protein
MMNHQGFWATVCVFASAALLFAIGYQGIANDLRSAVVAGAAMLGTTLVALYAGWRVKSIRLKNRE